MGGRDSYVEFTAVDGGEGGSCTLDFRFAISEAINRKLKDCKVHINGVNMGFAEFRPTGPTYSYYGNLLFDTACPSGKLRLRVTAANRNGGPNLNNVEVSGVGSPETPAPTILVTSSPTSKETDDPSAASVVTSTPTIVTSSPTVTSNPTISATDASTSSSTSASTSSLSPKLTFVPTLATMAPTDSEGCVEHPRVKFYWKKNPTTQKPIAKTCDWLRNVAKTRIRNILCKKGESFKEIPEAKEACPITCGICGCEDDNETKFDVGRFKRDCDWLKQMSRNGKKKIDFSKCIVNAIPPGSFQK